MTSCKSVSDNQCDTSLTGGKSCEELNDQECVYMQSTTGCCSIDDRTAPNNYSIRLNDLSAHDWEYGTDYKTANCNNHATIKGSKSRCSHYTNGRNQEFVKYDEKSSSASNAINAKGCPRTCAANAYYDKEFCWLGEDAQQCKFGDSSISGTHVEVTPPPAACTDVQRPKMVCDFKIQDPTDPLTVLNFAKILQQYHDAGKIDNDDKYQTYMKKYCLAKVTDNCPNDPYTGEPQSECPRMFTTDNSDIRQLCNTFLTENPTTWDAEIQTYCSKSENLKRPECDCINGEKKGSRFDSLFNAISGSALGVQGRQCWFKPCKDDNGRLLLNKYRDVNSCDMAACVNEIIINDSTVTNSELDQVVGDCTVKKEAKVDGGYKEWSSCSKSCGGGTQTRTCTNPKPSGGGKDCTGLGPSTQSCNPQDCPPGKIDGGFGPWEDCGEDCTQIRQCNNPSPSNGGADCQPDAEGGASRACTTGACIPSNNDDDDDDFGPWGECSKKCGKGIQIRECNDGATCKGETQRECNTQDCETPSDDWVDWVNKYKYYLIAAGLVILLFIFFLF